MNEQPAAYIGNLFAILFVAMILFYTVQGYNNPKSQCNITDNFTIGYIYDIPVQEKQIIAPKLKKVKQVQKTPLNPIYNDCIEALVALGMKKTQAKQKAKEVFENNQINDIQHFITLALQKI